VAVLYLCVGSVIPALVSFGQHMIITAKMGHSNFIIKLIGQSLGQDVL